MEICYFCKMPIKESPRLKIPITVFGYSEFAHKKCVRKFELEYKLYRSRKEIVKRFKIPKLIVKK